MTEPTHTQDTTTTTTTPSASVVAAAAAAVVVAAVVVVVTGQSASELHFNFGAYTNIGLPAQLSVV